MTMKRRLESLERLERLRPQPKAQRESGIDRLRAMLGLPPQTEAQRRSVPRASDPSDTRTAAEKLRDFLAEHKRNNEADDDPQ